MVCFLLSDGSFSLNTRFFLLTLAVLFPCMCLGCGRTKLIFDLKIGLAGLEVFVTAAGFWTATAQEYRDSVAKSQGSSKGGLKQILFKMPGAHVVWLCAIFLLGYVGVEVALGGWIVEFMIQVRHGGAFESGITATGFWLGLTIGRFVLGFITPKIGEKLAIMVRCIPNFSLFSSRVHPLFPVPSRE